LGIQYWVATAHLLSASATQRTVRTAESVKRLAI